MFQSKVSWKDGMAFEAELEGLRFGIDPDPEFGRQVHARMSASPRPVLSCWTAGQALAGAALEYFIRHGIPIFESPPRLVSALGALRDYWGFRLGPEFRAEGER